MDDRGTESELKMLSSSDNTKFNDRFYRLRKINKFTDCSFKIQNRVLNCHKLVLAAASPVFEAMFYGQFSHDMTNSVLITDSSFDTFELFLDFIYTGELKLSASDEIESLVEISYCAQKYLIDELRALCVEKLSLMLSRESVFKFLQLSFERHLEDFLVSIFYFFADSLETGVSLCNAMLNNGGPHLSSRCFEFLAKNLIDYFGEREDVLSLVKAWTIKKCHIDSVAATNDSIAESAKLLNLDGSLCSKVIQMKAGFFDSSAADKISKSFLRVYYKPVRQFIVDCEQMCFDLSLSFKRFVTIKSLTINSRMAPEQHDFCDTNSQTYVEKLTIEILDKSSEQTVYQQQHKVENVTFNEFFRVEFNDRMVLFPYHVYIFKIRWSEEAIGYEYPRAIFSLMERKGNDEKVDDNGNPLSIVQFHEYNYCYNLPFGSIVQGINYDVIS